MKRELTLLEKIREATTKKEFNEDWDKLENMAKKGQTRLLNLYLRRANKVKRTIYFEMI